MNALGIEVMALRTEPIGSFPPASARVENYFVSLQVRWKGCWRPFLRGPKRPVVRKLPRFK